MAAHKKKNAPPRKTVFLGGALFLLCALAGSEGVGER